MFKFMLFLVLKCCAFSLVFEDCLPRLISVDFFSVRFIMDVVEAVEDNSTATVQGEGVAGEKPVWYQDCTALFLQKMELLHSCFPNETLYNAVISVFLEVLAQVPHATSNMEESSAVSVKEEAEEIDDCSETTPLPETADIAVENNEKNAPSPVEFAAEIPPDTSSAVSVPAKPKRKVFPTKFQTDDDPAWKMPKKDLKIPKGRSRLCQLCGKVCQSPGQLKVHMANQHGVGKGEFSCPECGKVFPTKVARDNHHSRHNQPAVMCEVCGREFRSQQHLRQHAEIHDKIEYKCSFCHKIYLSSAYLKIHEARHKEIALGKFVCHICGKVMKAKDTLRGHMRNMHKDKPFECVLCDKKFLRIKALEDHQLVHKGERTFRCDQCDKAYFKKEILERHMLVHTGERPFACNICGARFVYTGSLANHVKIKHNMKMSDAQKQVQTVDRP